MDKLIYTAMTGAKYLMSRQDGVANNLAQTSTPGFRADTAAFRTVPVRGDGGATRSFVLDSTTGFDTTPGALQRTGRDLDVAIDGQGWFAVQASDGTEAYTRNGGFDVGADGQLATRSGQLVLSDGGAPIAIPPETRVTIARDGTVSAESLAQAAAPPTVLGRLKLVNPPPDTLVKGADGLIRTRSGEPADNDPAVSVVAGSLEGSNVNTVEALVSMIALSRQFDVQMKLMSAAETNARQASQLLSFGG